MKPDICSFCKGKLKEGKTNFIVKRGEALISITNVPAYVCNNCGEAYYKVETSKKIDKVMQDFNQGNFMAHPLAAGEVEYEKVA
jgi:YgiT-type zinc finger domain-containing protein